MYFLPALGTLYFALAGIWGLPYGEQLVGTITAIDTFLGVILGISKSKYNKCRDGSHQLFSVGKPPDASQCKIQRSQSRQKIHGEPF